MAEIKEIVFAGSHGLTIGPETYDNGRGQMLSVTSFEELMLPGPYGETPYIRARYSDGCWAEFPKHNLQGVVYEDG